MKAYFDKVIIIKDSSERISGIVIHDTQEHKKVFYSVSEMDMEGILNMLNSGVTSIYRDRDSESTEIFGISGTQTLIEEIDDTLTEDPK